MNKSSSYRGRFFSGERKITKKDSRTLAGGINKLRFENFINEFSDDAKTNLATKLVKIGISSANRDNAAEICADIFEAILTQGKYEIS